VTHHPNHSHPRATTQHLLHLKDESETVALGARLAPCLAPGMRVYLRGDLGAGKTTLVRGLVQGLGYAGRVKSPTYTLVELYVLSSLNFYHFDFYRFRDPNEWDDAGFRDYFNSQSVCLVEWPEKAEDLLPSPDLEICLAHGAAGREAAVYAFTRQGEACVTQLQRA
jgi:tRNA threonylcarbamoyladenosine biosynthesis protein TsaE